MLTELSKRLLDWYRRHARRMPWRGEKDPYRIWISEIMLQQTQVETVIPYYQRWMDRFPSLQALADASEQDVLQVWEGLGYYSRARNLHKCARSVIDRHGGVFPRERHSLEALPGIGRYTAGAIASIAFGLDEPALDGNIRRVFARLYALEIPARSPDGERQLWAWVSEHLPPGQAGDYNQALMDLGATLCTPRSPDCPRCPLAELCQARALGIQGQLPVVPPKASAPHLTVTAAVICQQGAVLLAQRPPEGFLGGMWEFPGGKQEDGEDLPACLMRELAEELGVQVAVGEPFGVYRHAYTHFRVTLHAYLCAIIAGEPQALHASQIIWAPPRELDGYPMGKIDRQIARRVQRVHQISGG